MTGTLIIITEERVMTVTIKNDRERENKKRTQSDRSPDSYNS